MSRRYAGSVRRLRAIVRDAPDVGRVEVMTEDVRRVLSTLDALDLTATRLESERATQRARADAAEAECARLTAERDAARAEAAGLRAEATVLIAERDDARLMSRCNHGNWRGALSDVDALRATTEGRAAPTEAEVRAHAATGGRWRARLSHGGIYTARYPDAAILDHDGALWWAIDRDDNNCPWPTVAAEAATALAGEGR